MQSSIGFLPFLHIDFHAGLSKGSLLRASTPVFNEPLSFGSLDNPCEPKSCIYYAGSNVGIMKVMHCKIEDVHLLSPSLHHEMPDPLRSLSVNETTIYHEVGFQD